MRKALVLLLVGIVAFLPAMYAQQPTYTPTIEACDCPVKIDSSFSTRCGYLVVPENRTKRNGKTIKLPFIVVNSKNPDKRKDPVLYTTGGPGGSSLGWARGATQSSIISNRDCIAFEQRGTHFALPNLWSTELADAIQLSYRKNLNKDSMVLEGTKRLKKSLEAKGIDLAGYNTDETVADIHDLLKLLQIDSVNLLGGSYSGGLMLAVLQKDPQRIRSLVLDSPLPTFVPIDEEEPANFSEALHLLFRHCEKDSVDKERYGNLEQRFRQYFNSIGKTIFYAPYLEKGSTDSLHVQYTRSELLQVLVDVMGNYNTIKEVPYVITEMMKGNHLPYINGILDGIFNGKPGPSGMRISVYCADQTAYHDENILRQLYNAYPYMKGYHINDVYREMCDCWKVPPIKPQTKQPFYTAKPALLADGEMDIACNPLYIDMIHHYMPNSQRMIFANRSHMVLGRKEMDSFVKAFLDEPLQKLETDRKDVKVY